MTSGWKHAASANARGYGAAWRRLRMVVLRRDKGMCQPCLRKGRWVEGAQVDHVTPKAKGGSDDLANLQAICGPCHRRKTLEDEGKRVKRRVAPDGWPLDD